MTRSQAKTLGLSKYLPMNPCAKGHDAMRQMNGPCVECAKIAKREWKKNYPEIAARSSCSAWAKANPERHRDNSSKWQKENIWYAIKATGDRRARKKSAEGFYTKEDRDDLFSRQNGTCQKCGTTERIEIDHIIPLSKGGSNWPGNLQLLCRSCNAKKKDKIEPHGA